LDNGWHLLATDVVLGEVASMLQSCLAQLLAQLTPPTIAAIAPGRRQSKVEEKPNLAAAESSPEPSEKNGLPSDSSLLPRA
jgi:hypothetical protein